MIMVMSTKMRMMEFLVLVVYADDDGNDDQIGNRRCLGDQRVVG